MFFHLVPVQLPESSPLVSFLRALGFTLCIILLGHICYRKYPLHEDWVAFSASFLPTETSEPKGFSPTVIVPFKPGWCVFGFTMSLKALIVLYLSDSSQHCVSITTPIILCFLGIITKVTWTGLHGRTMPLVCFPWAVLSNKGLTRRCCSAPWSVPRLSFKLRLNQLRESKHFSISTFIVWRWTTVASINPGTSGFSLFPFIPAYKTPSSFLSSSIYYRILSSAVKSNQVTFVIICFPPLCLKPHAI